MSFFNAVNQHLRSATGASMVREGWDGQSDWGEVNAGHIYDWNSALYSFYLALYMAGYEPDRTHFRLTQDTIVTLDHSTGLLEATQDSERKDVVVEFSEISVSPRAGIESVPLGIEIDPANTADFFELSMVTDAPPVVMPSFEFHNGGGSAHLILHEVRYLDLSMLSEADADVATSEILLIERSWLVDVYSDVLVAQIEEALWTRWIKSLDGDPPNGSWELTGEIVVNESDSVDAESVCPIDPFQVDGERVGLLWVFNPEFWEIPQYQTDTKLIVDVAKKLWKGFEKRGFGGKKRTEFEGQNVFQMRVEEFSALASKIFGVDHGRAQRFNDRIDLLVREALPDFPHSLVELSELPYLELIMTLVNYGVIGIGDLVGTADHLSFADADPLDYRYYSLKDIGKFHPGSGPAERIEVLVYGRLAATLTYQEPLREFDRGDLTGRVFELHDLVNFEFRERDVEPGEDAAEDACHHLLIVAAPGVHINAPRRPFPDVVTQIIRVSDQQKVSPIFTPIDAQEYYQPIPMEVLPESMSPVVPDIPQAEMGNGEDAISLPADSGELTAFSVRSLSDQTTTTGEQDRLGDLIGTEIEFPAGDALLPAQPGEADEDRAKLSDYFRLKIKLTHRDKFSHNGRFDFRIVRHWHDPEAAQRCWIDDTGQTNPLQMFSVIIHKTPDMKVEVETYQAMLPVGGGNSISPDFVRYYIYDVIEDDGPARKRPGKINLVPFDDGPLHFHPGHIYDAAKGQPELGSAVLSRESLFGMLVNWADGILPDQAEEGLEGLIFAELNESAEGVSFRIPNIRSEADPDDAIFNFRQHHSLQFVGPAPADYRQVDSWTEMFVKLSVDIGIGFIPVVGDIADLIEVAHVLRTGRDKWGDPVSGGQLVLMAGCAALPFVGTGVAKAAVRAVD